MADRIPGHRWAAFRPLRDEYNLLRDLDRFLVPEAVDPNAGCRGINCSPDQPVGLPKEIAHAGIFDWGSSTGSRYVLESLVSRLGVAATLVLAHGWVDWARVVDALPRAGAGTAFTVSVAWAALTVVPRYLPDWGRWALFLAWIFPGVTCSAYVWRVVRPWAARQLSAGAR